MPCPLLRSVGLSGAEKSSQTKTDVPGDKMRKKELCKQKVYLLLLKIDPTIKINKVRGKSNVLERENFMQIKK